ncbi:hypothetical protein PtB15_1B483 [Puccinia triticina]|nr:hypothetical protein PtB15_1B483 [Puccinia triticina]
MFKLLIDKFNPQAHPDPQINDEALPPNAVLPMNGLPTLHSELLPLLREPITALCRSSNPAGFLQEPESQLKKILHIQSELEPIMDQIQSIMTTVCPEPISSANQTDDRDLKGLKSYRLHFLKTEFDRGWWRYICQIVGEFYEEIQVFGLSSEGSTDRFNASSYRQNTGDPLALIQDSIDSAVERLKESEFDYVKNRWKADITNIEDTLESVNHLLRKSTLNYGNQEPTMAVNPNRTMTDPLFTGMEVVLAHSSPKTRHLQLGDFVILGFRALISKYDADSEEGYESYQEDRSGDEFDQEEDLSGDEANPEKDVSGAKVNVKRKKDLPGKEIDSDDEDLFDEQINFQRGLVKSLNSSLLPRLRHQITTMSLSLDPTRLQKDPEFHLDVILGIQSEFNQTWHEIKAALRILCRDSSSWKTENDRQLKELKYFRLSKLSTFIEIAFQYEDSSPTPLSLFAVLRMCSLPYKKSGQDPCPRPLPLSPSSSASTPTLPYQQAEKEFEHLHPPRSEFSHPKSHFLNMSSFRNPTGHQRSFSVGIPGQNQGEGREGVVLKRPRGFLQENIVIRWVFFITPILMLVWIPGFIAFSLPEKHLQIADVGLIWWSAWLSVAWLGWWIGLMVGALTPLFFKHVIGIACSPDFVEKWYSFLLPMKKVIMGAVWSISTYIAFSVFIIRMSYGASESAAKSVHLMSQALFGFLLASLMLVGEKILIQVIASYFHQRSYEDRIAEQKRAIQFLTALYRYTHDIGRSDTLDRACGAPSKAPDNTAKILKCALKSVKNVARTTTSVFGTVASEIAGEQILQPNSPSSMVLSALSSANKTRHLARRIYYSLVPVNYRQVMVLGDIMPCFEGDEEIAQESFSIFDKDRNGDCSLQEIELTCLELHRERLALVASMRDLDSAVGKLDSILMFLWYTVSLLVTVALLDISFQTLLASAGTLVLGLSWLIGSTAQEILASIIFLFVKHPYDVSDRVDVDDVAYVVKEMHLLYTVFRQTNGKISQIPHSVLNSKRVVNIRRSGPISEKFTWDVNFNTSFEKIEQMRSKMLEFLKAERRDYTPAFDVNIQDFEGQAQLTLQADIKYKSNWQNGALKSQRRNKWVCALKQIMAEVEIYGPADAGNPAPKSEPTLIQLVDSPPLVIHQRAESPRKQQDQQNPPSDKSSGIQPVELENRENVMCDDDDEEHGLPLNYIPLSPF